MTVRERRNLSLTLLRGSGSTMLTATGLFRRTPIFDSPQRIDPPPYPTAILFQIWCKSA